MGYDRTYPWKRYWIRRGGQAHLNGGFLVDPERNKLFNRDAVSLHEIAETRCLVLLGEPGIGKSRELARLDARDSNSLLLNLRGYFDQKLLREQLFESAKFTEWLNSTHELELILDSLDECLIHIRTVAAWLVDEFRRYPVSRLKLRIACRTAEFPPLLDEELPQIWGPNQFGVYELAPLRREDVAVAAEIEGLDKDLFLNAVHGASAEPLASNPITLKFLLKEFHPDKGLPHSPFELYERGCRRLCTEPSSSRRASGAKSPFADRELLAVAERIAAATMFSGLATIYVGEDQDAGRSEITLSQLEGTDVIDGTSVTVTRDMVQGALLTSLFSGRSASRLGFAHWTYAEFLAARFCISRQLTVDQISDLVFHPDADDRPQIVPQLAECAAWIASKIPEFLLRVANSDPQVLLRSSVVGMDMQTRAKVARCLLDLFEQGKLLTYEEGFRPRYEILAHAGLETLVTPIIQTKGRDFVVRRIAIDMAVACKLVSLSSILADIAVDATDEFTVRDHAARAVAEIGEVRDKVRLVPLLTLPEHEDPDEQLKGYALRALWPEHLTSAEMFAHLTPPRRRNFLGAYAFFVRYELPAQLNADHLPAAIGWLNEKSEEVAGSHEDAKLIRKIMQLAWDHLDRPGVSEGFAMVVIRQIEHHRSIFPQDLEDSSEFDLSDVRRRRKLISLLVDRLAHGDRRGLLRFQVTDLIAAEDFGWLLREFFSSADEAQKKAWAILIRSAFRSETPEHLDLFLEACQNEPSLAVEFADWIEPIHLDSSQAQRGREQLEDFRKSQHRRAMRPPAVHPPMAEMVRTCLERFDNGNESAWWQLNLDLTLESHSDYYNDALELNGDLTSLPGWSEIDNYLRGRCVTTAEKYLQIANPETREWLGTNAFHRPAAAGYRAFRLLLDIKPDELDRLSPNHWAEWAPAILGFPEFVSSDAESKQSMLVGMAYAKAPVSVLAALMILIDKEKGQGGNLFVLRMCEHCIDERFVTALLQKVKDDHTLPARSLGDIFAFILPEGGDEARETALKMVSKKRLASEERAKAVVIAVETLNKKPTETWETLWPMITNDDLFGKEVIALLAAHHEQSHTARIAMQLPEDSVGDLYVWLCMKFPRSGDPHHEGAHAVGTREHIAMFRDAVLSRLQERGTKLAINVIRRIAGELPNERWLGYAALVAERGRLRKTWKGERPEVVLGMAASRRIRAVQSSSQLLAIIEDSLKRLNAKLHGETAAVPDLWDGDVPKDENAVSDYVKRHLESDLNEFGVLAFREPEVRRGQETDIYVTALVHEPVSGRFERISVIVEVKGCWNEDLKTAMRTQLKGKYLNERGGCGLYLVAWFLCDAWREEPRRRKTPKLSFDIAVETFNEQANSLSDEKTTLAAFVLDTRRR